MTLLPLIGSRKDLRMVMAKYSYKANPSRPGGFDELTIKQTEKIYFHNVHPQNPHWVKAENEEGIVGYVPANYIIVSTFLFNNHDYGRLFW